MAKMKDVFVRGVDEDTHLEFKSKSVRLRKNIGDAFNEAMKLWLESQSSACQKH